MENNKISQIGAFLCFLSIALGAFGAHSFKAFLEANNHQDTFETASKYLMYGGLLTLIQSFFAKNSELKKQNTSAIIMIISTLIFSGSLYSICFTGIKTFGAIAPIGGLGMMISLIYFIWTFKKS